MTIKLTKNAKIVLEKRYLMKDENGKIIETPEELFRRVAKKTASAEKAYGLTDKQIESWEEKFYDIMSNLYMVPNTPCLINFGRPGVMQQGSACFVTPVEDSLSAIYDSLKWSALIHKTGGGVGHSFAKLRPKGATISNGASSSTGPIEFMKVFNASTEAVKQGASGRRGANMAILPVDHPDIEEFIHLKDDLTQMNNFNISVAITDAFIDAYKKDKEYELIDPRTNKPYILDGKIQTRSARKIMREIAQSAYNTGEPGVVFIDKVNQTNPVPTEKIWSSNPCLHKETLILNKNKVSRIGSGQYWGKSWKTGVKKCIKLITNAGHEIIVTKDHKIMLNDGSFLEAQKCLDAEISWGLGDLHSDLVKDDIVILGFLFGDGFLSGKKQGISSKINDIKEHEVAKLLKKYNFNKQKSGAYYINKKELSLDTDFLNQNLHDRTIPEKYFNEFSEIEWKSFVRGLFEANGSCNKQSQISLKATNKDTIQKIQIILSAFGIKSWICENKSQKINWNNGSYISKTSYNLQIAPRNAYKFFEEIGFLSKYKNDKIKRFDKEYSGILKIKQIIDVGEHEVWDFTNEVHYESANGIVVHNCSEQFLPDFDSCTLASIDVSKFVENKTVDWNKLADVVSTSVRFLDNVLDINEYPLPQITKQTLSNRRIGLGIMGFADYLIKLGIRYNSEEGFKAAGDLMKFVQEHAKESSMNIAIEKDSFPNWKDSIFRVPMRNATVTTVAPTGSISIIAGCSGGLEPYYGICFERDQAGVKMVDANPIFEKMAKDLGFYSKELMAKIAHEGSIQNIKEIPSAIRELFVVASDIKPEDHIKMQAEFQKHVCNAISKTINHDNSATVDDIEKAYIMAYDYGCKSVAVYRDGCRENQVLSVGKTKKKAYIETIVQRPDIVAGVTYKVQTSFGKLYITINKVGDVPIEVFFSMADISNDMSSLLSALGRTLSVSLKHGTPLKDIIKTLKKVKVGTVVYYNGKMFKSVPQLIAGVFEEVFSGKESPAILVSMCDKCGSQLILQEGCEKCSNAECGYTKCG